MQQLGRIANERFCGFRIILQLPHKPCGHIPIGKTEHIPVFSIDSACHDFRNRIRYRIINLFQLCARNNKILITVTRAGYKQRWNRDQARIIVPLKIFASCIFAGLAANIILTIFPCLLSVAALMTPTPPEPTPLCANIEGLAVDRLCTAHQSMITDKKSRTCGFVHKLLTW